MKETPASVRARMSLAVAFKKNCLCSSVVYHHHQAARGRILVCRVIGCTEKGTRFLNWTKQNPFSTGPYLGLSSTRWRKPGVLNNDDDDVELHVG